MELTLEPILYPADLSNDRYSSECRIVLHMWNEYIPKIGYHPPWIGYLVKDNDAIVGVCGYTGPPIENRIEVSYGTFKDYQGKGVATFACKRLVAMARETDPNLVITAKTAPEFNASVRVLKQNGFVYSQVVQDHEIGDAWEWIWKGESRD